MPTPFWIKIMMIYVIFCICLWIFPTGVFPGRSPPPPLFCTWACGWGKLMVQRVAKTYGADCIYMYIYIRLPNHKIPSIVLRKFSFSLFLLKTKSLFKYRLNINKNSLQLNTYPTYLVQTLKRTINSILFQHSGKPRFLYPPLTLISFLRF